MVSEEHGKQQDVVLPDDQTVKTNGHQESPEPNWGIHIDDVLNEQDDEAEEFALKFLTTVLRLRGVRIERNQFLKAELHKHGVAKADIDRAIDDSPGASGIPPKVLDEIAKASVNFERNKSATISFAAGVPGGFAMLATIPGDITQFYVHVFRIMQKLAYIYGWQSFLDDTEDIDDETLGMLTSFLGVMMGIASATGSVRYFAIHVARPAVEKKIANVALTKTAWYLPMKQTLRVIGVQVTKQSFARSVTKVIPLLGGVVSGSFTYVAFNAQSKRLMQHLRELPPPNVDAAEYLAAVKLAEETASAEHQKTEVPSTEKASGVSRTKKTGQGVAPALQRTGSNIAGKLGALRRPKNNGASPADEVEEK